MSLRSLALLGLPARRARVSGTEEGDEDGSSLLCVFSLSSGVMRRVTAVKCLSLEVVLSYEVTMAKTSGSIGLIAMSRAIALSTKPTQP